MSKLTEHQQEKLEECIKLLRSNPVIRLEGSAGTGKTFLINTLIQHLLYTYTGNICCSAPTHKALAVLKDKVTGSSRVFFTTTHSALRLKRVINEKSGDIDFKPSYDRKNVPLKGIKYFIVDEGSMLNTKILELLEEHARKQGCKIIYVGDSKQINPVGEQESPVFERVYPAVTLTEIVRQTNGNPIIELSNNLSLIKDQIPKKIDNKGYIFTSEREKVLLTLAKVNGSNDLKYVAYTNNEVDKINSDVRRIIYTNPNKIEVGESLVFNAPYMDEYFNNEEIRVEDLLVREKTFDILVDMASGETKPAVLKYYSINPVKINTFDFLEKDSWDTKEESQDNIVDKIMVIHEDSELEFKNVCKNLILYAKLGKITWSTYYDFVETFADLKYNHALTIHKSQGSTFKQTIVNVRDINLNQNATERERLLYTAVTRSSELLILYNV